MNEANATKDRKLAVITGASSGIGAAVARAFAKEGHPLLLLARRLDRMEALGLENAFCREVDVRDRDALVSAVQEAEREFGATDFLFNNAGIARLADIATQPPEDWQEMIDINAMGAMNALYAVLEGMKERQCGTIVNMSSIAGRKIYPDHTVYCGTKFFLHAVSESLRGYLAPYNVRVIVISPGIINTEVLDGVKDKTTLKNYKEYKERIGGGVSADYVADMILYAYRLPQRILIQEICVTPTRQDY